MVNDVLRREYVARREYDALGEQLAQANARVAELTAEVGRLADLVARGNDRITELLAIAQRKKGGARSTSTDKAPEPPLSLDDAAKGQRLAKEARRQAWCSRSLADDGHPP